MQKLKSEYIGGFIASSHPSLVGTSKVSLQKKCWTTTSHWNLQWHVNL